MFILAVVVIGYEYHLYTLSGGRNSNNFMNAARTGDYIKVKSMLDKGADPNSRYTLGLIKKLILWIEPNPDYEYKDTTVLVEATANGHTEIVRLLIEKGANVNDKCFYQFPNLQAHDPTRYTALQIAKLAKFDRIINLLKNAGAM